MLMSILIFLTSCAHVPRESAELSRNIGTGIAENHQAHVALINLYFAQKREAIDGFIEKDFTPQYIATVQTKLGTNSFDAEMMRDVIQRIAHKRDVMQSELEQSRLAVLDRVESNNALLLQASAQLTALLTSAANVEEADGALTGALKNASGGRIDFAAMDKKFEDYLQRAGDLSQKTASIYDELQSTITNIPPLR